MGNKTRIEGPHNHQNSDNNDLPKQPPNVAHLHCQTCRRQSVYSRSAVGTSVAAYSTPCAEIHPLAAPLSHKPPPPLSKRAGAPLLLAERILPCSIFSPADFFALFLVRETFLDILQKFIISNHWLRQK